MMRIVKTSPLTASDSECWLPLIIIPRTTWTLPSFYPRSLRKKVTLDNSCIEQIVLFSLDISALSEKMSSKYFS